MTFPVGAYDALNKKQMQIQRKKFIANRIAFAYRATASCGGNIFTTVSLNPHFQSTKSHAYANFPQADGVAP